MGDEHYVIVKFTSGEQVMAVLLEETTSDVTIVYPMQIRMTPILDVDGAREHVTATPWNKFAADPEITQKIFLGMERKTMVYIQLKNWNQ